MCYPVFVDSLYGGSHPSSQHSLPLITCRSKFIVPCRFLHIVSWHSLCVVSCCSLSFCTTLSNFFKAQSLLVGILTFTIAARSFWGTFETTSALHLRSTESRSTTVTMKMHWWPASKSTSLPAPVSATGTSARFSANASPGHVLSTNFNHHHSTRLLIINHYQTAANCDINEDFKVIK